MKFFFSISDAEPVKKEVKDTSSDDDKKRELLGELKDLLKTASKNLDKDIPMRQFDESKTGEFFNKTLLSKFYKETSC